MYALRANMYQSVSKCQGFRKCYKKVLYIFISIRTDSTSTSVLTPSLLPPSVTEGSLYVDLEKVGTDLVWGDGTRYNDTEIGQNVVVKPFGTAGRYIMVFWDMQLSDGRPGDSRQFMCQANPLGVLW